MMVLCINAINGYGQMVADTFENGLYPYSSGTPSPTAPAGINFVLCWVKYTPYELAQRGIVPGVIIYGVAYHKPNNGYLPSNTTATLEVKLRSGSMDSTIPNYSGPGAGPNYYINNYMTGGFASWTIFTNGSNFSIPATTGWQAPLLVDVPFVYTGGALEICTKFQAIPNNAVGDIYMSIENPPYSNINLSYYYQIGTGIGSLTWISPTTIIYHSAAPLPCNGIPIGGIVSGNANPCSGQDFKLYLNSPSAGPGISYQWQQSTITPVNWVAISGATNPVVTTSVISPTLFRCKVTCNNSNQYVYSSSFTVNPYYFQIDSVTAVITNNIVKLFPHTNDTSNEIWGSNYNTQWTLLSNDTLPFTLNTDGYYNINVRRQNSCNIDTFVKTLYIGCQGAQTFHDSIAYSIKTCPGNPVTINLLDTLPANYTTEWQAYLNFQWTTLTGLTTPSVTVNPTTNTIYRNKSTCNISTNFKYSNYDTVWVTPPPTAGTIQAINTTTNYYNFTNTGMSNAQSYKWYFGDGDSSSSLAPSHHYNLQGTYNVWFVVTNAGNGCTDTAFTTVTITTGVEDVQGKLFSFSPNPFKEGFTVSCPSCKGTITILNSVGQLIIMKPISSSDHCQLSTENWSSGVYLIRYKDNEGRTETRKITKQ